MRVILVGAGGREAALAWKIVQSPLLEDLWVTGESPGWPEGVKVHPATGTEPIIALAHQVAAELVVVGPEAPLAQGLADRCEAEGFLCFGPVEGAARLEASKAFAKEVMAAVGVATAEAMVVDRHDEASVAAARARCDEGRVVVKADGLAAGKGVFVCPSAQEAHEALDAVWSGRFGPASDKLVLEELLEGPEVSVFGLCDGERVVGMPSAQDHKRLGDGDLGPNTGGMGAYAPCPLLSREQVDEVIAEVHLPVIRELARRGAPFRGVLYAGLMLTPQGVRVLEFNVRFGDPECQPLMCLWEDDILPWLKGAAEGALPSGAPTFRKGASCCVVLASAGYPVTSEKGQSIPEGPLPDQVVAFLAGTRRDPGGVLRTHGGRVLGVTARGADLAEARDRAYAGVQERLFEGCQWRRDIAEAGLRGES